MNIEAYKVLFEQSPELLIVIDTDFIILNASDAYLKTTKTHKETIVGQYFFTVFPHNPNDSTANGESSIRASFNRVVENKIFDTINVVKYDIPKPEAEGGGFTVKYWQPCHTPVLDEFNNVKYIIQNVKDVTENEGLIAELKLDKTELKKVEDSEKRYNLMFMRSPFGFAVLKGENMVISQANDSIKELWGKGNDIEGKPLFEVIPELKESEYPELLQSVYTTGIPFQGNELLAPSLIRKGKTEDVYFNFIYQPYLEANETISGVAVIAYEVTAQVTVKKALAEQHAAEQKALKSIEESNNRYYTMLMQSPFAFSIMKGKDMVITLANDLMKEFWGKGKDVEGKTLLQLLPELQDQPFPEMIEKAYTTGIPVSANEILGKLTYNGQLKHKYFNVVFQPYYEADNSISGVIQIAYEVTDHVLALVKVEESEHRFQAAVAAVQGIIWTNNAKGEMETEQLGWAALTGQTYEQYHGYGWINTIHPDDAEATLIAWNESVKQEKNFVFEHRVKMKNGSWGRFSINAIPLLNANGQITEWVGVHTNITEQRQLEDAVKASEKHFRLMADLMPTKISSADAEGNLIYLNKQWLDFTGLDFEEQKEKGYYQIIHPEDLALFEFEFRNAFKNGTNVELEMRFENKDGEYKWHLNIVSPIKDENGKIIMWIGSATDIHLRKTKIEKIKESETMFRQLVAQAPVAICVLRGKDYVVEVINSGMTEMWHKEEVDVINKPAFEVLPELIEQGVRLLLDNVCKTGDRLVVQELPITLNRNGHPADIFVKFVYEPLFEVDGSISGIMVLAHDITDQVIARKSIQNSEKRYYNMLMQSPFAFSIMKGKDMEITLANDLMKFFWGKGENVENKTLLQILPELKNQPFPAMLNSVYTTGIPINANEILAKITHNDKLEDHYFNIVYQPLIEDDEKVSGVITIAYEVTEIVLARKKMEAQAKMVHELVRTAPGFVCTLIGPTHIYDLLNERYQQFFGKRQLRGKAILDALPELAGQGFDTLLDNVYNTGKPYMGFDMPITMARDEGLLPELVYFNFSYQPIYNEHHKIFGILVFGYEVTEQVIFKNKNLETQAMRANELEENVQQRTFELIEANKTLEEKNKELALQNEEKEKKAQELIVTNSQLAFQSGEKEKKSAELIIANKELAFQSGEKEKKSAELIIANKKLAYQSSEKEKRAAELILINKELESFTYISSHDLQEPLRKIQTFARRILEKEYATLSENGKDYFRRMQNAANRMQTLIEDLLSYSHTNVSDRKFEKTNLTKIVKDIKIELSEMIIEKNAIVEIGELHELTINPSQFRQVINNLITNALKFSRPNVQPHIKISSSTGTGSQFQEQNQDLPIGRLSGNLIYYHIKFTDNGIGFEPEYKNKIFELFQRLHGKEDYAGTGIGLAIVKKIIDNHNGIITASSELDKGATFDIYIPFE